MVNNTDTQDAEHNDGDYSEASPPILCLQWNDLTVPISCAICDSWFEPQIGINLFLDGEGWLVCDTCGLIYAPELVAARDILKEYAPELLHARQQAGKFNGLIY